MPLIFRSILRLVRLVAREPYVFAGSVRTKEYLLSVVSDPGLRVSAASCVLAAGIDFLFVSFLLSGDWYGAVGCVLLRTALASVWIIDFYITFLFLLQSCRKM